MTQPVWLREKNRVRMINDNPMKNPEIVSRKMATQKSNKKRWVLPERSKSHREKLASAWTDERRKKTSDRMKNFNPMRNKNSVIKSQEGQKEFMASGGSFAKIWNDPIRRESMMAKVRAQRSAKEYREKKSDWASKRIIECNMRNSYSNSGFYYSEKNGKQIFYRSEMERDAYVILENNPDVSAYKNEPFRIPYSLNGIRKFYVPDILVFFVNGTRMIIEVKPRYRLKYNSEIIKIESGKSYCYANNMPYAIWTEIDIYG